MENRVAVITGGGRGIGRAIGLAIADEGWSIALCYRTSEKESLQTKEEIAGKGVRSLAAKCDVADPKQCESFVRQVEKEMGRIDALINCAGPYHRVPLLKETPEGWSEMISANLHSVFYMSRLVAPGMMEGKWGRIINFSMANADRMVAQPQITAHYIAKTGVLVLTRTLAKTLGPHNVTVNAISPGFIQSGSAPAEELEKMIKNIPAGYIGELKDAASASKFLLSEESRYVNGTNIHLSGGWGI